ncbi:MAG: hypothetical protein CMQ29_12350 [Gammaproteobacteria bacterium]|nr:hypothetical protein [Gammaproteobacteria bacterium]
MSFSDRVLSARIIALDNPTFEANEEDVPQVEPLVDMRNPEPALHERRVLGLDLRSVSAFIGKRWGGKIYDPESGNMCSSCMRVDRAGSLAMRLYWDAVDRSHRNV